VRIIGVVDLLGGRAVHARAGQRERYGPVRAVAGCPIDPGDAAALATVYLDALGLAELYVADLDAIAGRTTQDAAVAAVAALGAPIWLDAGVSSIDQARHALDLGAARVVVGLETLQSYDALEAICGALGGDRVAFSLDMRDGKAVTASTVSTPAGVRGGIQPEAADLMAARAAEAGVGAAIVIDLARVGTGTGLDREVIARVRAAAPKLTLLAGGGIRGMEDLVWLAHAGYDGALVATALHDGRLGAADVAAARQL
jgi:phosphoribosylformimino-5-aminoimidazole carboxamide ribotide isomerase